ncbi:thermonuclease family protein [Litoreibacter sp.]|nr:thermonuclease family protein [Litoreibacter sp.]
MRNLVLALIGLALPIAGVAQETAHIIDGDTIEQDGVTYRIHGIDAPEYGQKCGSSPCGKLSVEALAVLAEGKRLECESLTEDGYGRTIARCTVDGLDIGAEMVRLGQAWAFVRFSDDYVPQETLARAEGVGVWRGEAVAPWIYREQRWDKAKAVEQDAPEGCPIKGNISQNGRIYHPPWSPWYKRTKINTSKGERWFCDEGEAVQAGWRAPKWR